MNIEDLVINEYYYDNDYGLCVYKGQHRLGRYEFYYFDNKRDGRKTIHSNDIEVLNHIRPLTNKEYAKLL